MATQPRVDRYEAETYITPDGECYVYSVVDGYDSKGRPNKWRSTRICPNDTGDTGGGGGGGGGGGTSVSAGASSGVGVGTNFKHPFEDILSGGLTFPDPGLQAELEAAEQARLDALAATFAWDGGAHSIATIPPGWVGKITFDVPDVRGNRPVGVAVGLCPQSAAPTTARDGYDHLQHAVVFYSAKVKLIVAGRVALELPLAGVLADRAAAGTDEVIMLLNGSMLKWVINGTAYIATPFVMATPYVLDAVLYATDDAVDNPKIIPGDWGDSDPDLEDGSLQGALGALAMEGDASRDSELTGALGALAARLSQAAYSDLEGALGALRMSSAHSDGVTAALGRLHMRAYETKTYGAVEVSLGALSMTANLREPDPDIEYSVLFSNILRWQMTATMPPVMTGEMALAPLYMRASAETTYSELAAPLGGLRAGIYMGEFTPLEFALEYIAAYVPILQSTYVSLAFVERIDGSTMVVVATVTSADAVEQVSVDDQLTLLQTFLTGAVEQIGVLERARLVAFDDQGETGGEAWVVNTATRATTRYDRYGFNSFAAIGGRHYGARADGIYLLEGASDANRPIKSGIALGQHDFGTQALKGIDAVYAGVSSVGTLFLKVGDGRTHYTYRARRNDPHMKVQRFDVGRGLRTNYFTFELTSEADAFELDSVTFHVLASQRRI